MGPPENMLEILETKELGIGYQVWPAGSILASLLLNPDSSVAKLVRNKTILELGSGCGIAGLAAALAGAKKIFLTDRKEVVPHLRQNVEINRAQIPASSCVWVEELEWGTEIDQSPINKEAIDVIIASDCMYWASLYDKLIMTLLRLSAPRTLVLLVHQTRRRAVERTFYERLSNFFVVSRVCPLSIPPTPSFTLVHGGQHCDPLSPSLLISAKDCVECTAATAPVRSSGPPGDGFGVGCMDNSVDGADQPCAPRSAARTSTPESDLPRAAGVAKKQATRCMPTPHLAVTQGEAAEVRPAAEEAETGAGTDDVGPVYLAYCRLRRSVTAAAAAAALDDFARDQYDSGYLLRQLDLMADDIASIRPA